MITGAYLCLKICVSLCEEHAFLLLLLVLLVVVVEVVSCTLY